MSVIDSSKPTDFSTTLISLLNGIIEAQAKAGQAVVEYIEEVGLTQPISSENAGSSPSRRGLKTVSFSYQKLDENDEIADFVLSVPLLSIVGVPTVMIKDATIKFTYDVTRNTTVEEPPASALAPVESASVPSHFSAATKQPEAIRGRVQRVAVDTASKGGIEVELNIEGSTSTVGLDRVFDILDVAISNTKLEVEEGGDDE